VVTFHIWCNCVKSGMTHFRFSTYLGLPEIISFTHFSKSIKIWHWQIEHLYVLREAMQKAVTLYVRGQQGHWKSGSRCVHKCSGMYSLHCHKLHYHLHCRRPANQELGHLLTCSGLTHPEISLMVSPDSFCCSVCSFFIILGNLFQGILLTCCNQFLCHEHAILKTYV
jgi:hypothetical protein